ncbi:LapA family protein [Paeniglutamicibacter sulfureus]|uniref:Integral membrane protein n=1 Tax=Paeniglutamicibacter sulfureus TaxID=43666 RepID=A0ABU2BMY6_9MICC|nr:LapA family protein [Paeniglutamicibacter sulfureus]MDR7359309.1 putative integral membrane protein [Paeniglutamicibacter sulfureus]
MSETPGSTRNPVLRFFARLSAKNWIAIVGAVLAAIFILQNRQRVRIEFLFLDLNAPLWISLGAVLLMGWVMGRFSFRKR